MHSPLTDDNIFVHVPDKSSVLLSDFDLNGIVFDDSVEDNADDALQATKDIVGIVCSSMPIDMDIGSEVSDINSDHVDTATSSASSSNTWPDTDYMISCGTQTYTVSTQTAVTVQLVDHFP